MAPKLYPQTQKLRTVIVTVPIIGATACALALTTASRCLALVTDALYECLVHGSF